VGPADATPQESRPAFYALKPGGWHDYVTLLHVPYTAWHLAYVVVGGCLVAGVAWGRLALPAYNLELLGGRVHTDLAFALAWGAFPVVTAFVAQASAIHAEAILAAVWATLLSLAQRRLSIQVRRVRRGAGVSAEERRLADAPESALKLLAASTVAVAAALVALRL